MNFTPMIIFLIFVGAAFVAIIWGSVSFFKGDEIRTTHKIEPIRYELTVKDNKIDTVFIYSLK